MAGSPRLVPEGIRAHSRDYGQADRQRHHQAGQGPQVHAGRSDRPAQRVDGPSEVHPHPLQHDVHDLARGRKARYHAAPGGGPERVDSPRQDGTGEVRGRPAEDALGRRHPPRSRGHAHAVRQGATLRAVELIPDHGQGRQHSPDQGTAQGNRGDRRRGHAHARLQVHEGSPDRGALEGSLEGQRDDGRFADGGPRVSEPVRRVPAVRATRLRSARPRSRAGRQRSARRHFHPTQQVRSDCRGRRFKHRDHHGPRRQDRPSQEDHRGSGQADAGPTAPLNHAARSQDVFRAGRHRGGDRQGHHRALLVDSRHRHRSFESNHGRRLRGRSRQGVERAHGRQSHRARRRGRVESHSHQLERSEGTRGDPREEVPEFDGRRPADRSAARRHLLQRHRGTVCRGEEAHRGLRRPVRLRSQEPAHPVHPGRRQRRDPRRGARQRHEGHEQEPGHHPELPEFARR